MPAAATQHIGIIGLGLVAGSLALALKRAGWSGDFIAWDPDPLALAQGLQRGVIDRSATSLVDVVSSADIVVIGAPPRATADALIDVLTCAESLANPPVVTDLASIKGFISEAAPGSYPFFVPAHPIAGSEHSGVASARADLFDGRELIITPRQDTAADAQALVAAMWRRTGAWVSTMSIEDHDAALAASSHAPHMIAYALTAALTDHPLTPMRHGGGSLRDMTRIAASDPVMWRDIALTNREALLAAIDDFNVALGDIRQLIDVGDAEGLRQRFLRCRNVRRDHDQILNPTPYSAAEEGAAS